ncbi:Sodium-coupled monocarboxylate transporter 2 [Armadillidium vulgare]|nr:Sodium-coupled monocarboxylate transporter 2 [Armadillidium vulgare]
MYESYKREYGILLITKRRKGKKVTHGVFTVEYIEYRFKSKTLFSVIFLLSTVKNLFLSGITLFAPTIALVSITKLGYLTNIFLLGIVCTLYSSLGGIKAVIWTDVFQISVMIIGLISVLAIGASLNGGITETLYIASKGGRLEMFE